MKEYILGIDQGTTGTTTALVNRRGEIEHKASVRLSSLQPRPGWVEQDPEEIWTSVEKSISNLLESSGVSSSQIVSIGITNQRETTVVFDPRMQKPSPCPAIVWQCRRSEEICERHRSHTKRLDRIVKKTGLVMDPYFSATKMQWLVENDGLPSGDKSFAMGTVDSYLLSRMTGGKSFFTDVTNASRTLLMDLKTESFDADLKEIFNVSDFDFAEITPSLFEFGTTKGMSSLRDGIPIQSVMGDQQSALFGQRAFSPGDGKLTLGTGSFLLVNTGAKRLRSKSGLLTTIAWKIGGETTYALEGGVFACGAAFEWVKRNFKGMDSDKDISDWVGAGFGSDNKEAKDVESSLWFVPAFQGLGAPHWNAQARGVFLGMTLATGPGEIARSLIDGVAHQNADLFDCLNSDGVPGFKERPIRVDGGVANSDALLATLAHLSQKTVERPRELDTTALGTSWLAGVGAGFWSLDELRAFSPPMESFEPSEPKAAKHRRKSWKMVIRLTEQAANFL